MLALAIAAAAR